MSTNDLIRQRIVERVEEMGKPEIAEKLKDKEHFSSLDIALLADELDTSFHYLVTGEPDPWEVRIIGCTQKDMDAWR